MEENTSSEFSTGVRYFDIYRQAHCCALIGARSENMSRQGPEIKRRPRVAPHDAVSSVRIGSLHMQDHAAYIGVALRDAKAYIIVLYKIPIKLMCIPQRTCEHNHPSSSKHITNSTVASTKTTHNAAHQHHQHHPPPPPPPLPRPESGP